ncbi:hypothetical protein CQA57_07250 [Helicobacter anseris]|uniref:Uncharacterized protein n=1 Tax=Helicobacter anseris TaxID=375926 RepID=A0A3D8J386_9HELI|nr:hypothetical protein [Helicobacter anseris]RDU71987.1 hypothetical protein CQA57_07250 [Helicobacter anseris]
MQALFKRILNSIRLGFPQMLKSFAFKPLIPIGRFDYTIHFFLFTLLQTLISIPFIIWITLAYMRNSMIELFILICIWAVLFLFPAFRITMSRMLDLRMHFNDSTTLFFTPKKMLLSFGICFVISLIVGYFGIKIDYFDFYPFDTLFLSFKLFLSITLSLAFITSNILGISLCFPAKTFNLFENVGFSTKTKEFLFFASLGILFIFVVFYTLIYNPIGILFAGIITFVLCFIAMRQNFYAGFLFLLLSLSLLLDFVDFLQNSRFLNLSYIMIQTSFFIALILLTCRKNFFLTLIVILGYTHLINIAYWGFLIYLYFLLIADFFDFKSKKGLLYSSLWAICVSGAFIFIIPLLNPPSWLNSIPKLTLFACSIISSMGIIFLNCKLKNQAKSQLVALVCVSILLYILNIFSIDAGDFWTIFIVLFFWIISNDQQISSAYKLAICSLFIIILFPLPTIFSQSLLSNLFYFLPFCSIVILTYLAYKIKFTFRIVFLAYIPCAFIVSVIASRYYSIFPTLLKANLFFNAVVLALICYLLYKHRDSFNPNLTLKSTTL